MNNSNNRNNVVQWHAFSLLNQPYGVQILFLQNILYITSPIYNERGQFQFPLLESKLCFHLLKKSAIQNYFSS